MPLDRAQNACFAAICCASSTLASLKSCVRASSSSDFSETYISNDKEKPTLIFDHKKLAITQHASLQNKRLPCTSNVILTDLCINCITS